MTDEDLDLVQQMRWTSRGAYCEACARHGRLRTTRRDTTALGEGDRCPGCMRLVCDRHTPLDDPTLPHIMASHLAEPRVVVREVPHA